MTLPAEPRCMTPAEIAAWWRTNRSITSYQDRDDSPCRDCSRAFANGMRLVGRCNGSYPGEFVDVSLAMHGHALDTRGVSQPNTEGAR